MKYADRQEQNSIAEQGKSLLVTFRDNRKAIAKALMPLIGDNYQINKTPAYQTLCKAIAHDVVWEPIADLVDELAGKVFERPSQYCTPPEIPDEWNEFRTMARDFASSTWWHATLLPNATASSWQSQLARPITPRHWEETRKIARAWRARVIECAVAWEAAVQEQNHVRYIKDFRIKDMMLAGEHENDHGALFDEYFRLWMLDKEHLDRATFDPANPTSEPFLLWNIHMPDWGKRRDKDRWAQLIEDWRAEARAEFDEKLAADFPNWLPATPPELKTEIQQYKEDVGNWENEMWTAKVEAEVTEVWNDAARRVEASHKFLRVLVRYGSPEPYEEIFRDNATVNVSVNRVGSEAETREAARKMAPRYFVVEDVRRRGAGGSNYELTGYWEYSLRWREWHPEEDLRHFDLYDRALRAHYKALSDGEGDFVSNEPKSIDRPPIEPHDKLSYAFEYTRD